MKVLVLLIFMMYTMFLNCGEKKEHVPTTESQKKEPQAAVSKIENLIRNQMPSFAMLNDSPGDYINEEITLYGYAKLMGYYNCGYRDAQSTHYSIALFDRKSSCVYVYFPKNDKNRKLFELVGGADFEGIPLKVKAKQLGYRYEHHRISQYLPEGLDWEMIK